MFVCCKVWNICGWGVGRGGGREGGGLGFNLAPVSLPGTLHKPGICHQHGPDEMAAYDFWRGSDNWGVKLFEETWVLLH